MFMPDLCRHESMALHSIHVAAIIFTGYVPDGLADFLLLHHFPPSFLRASCALLTFSFAFPGHGFVLFYPSCSQPSVDRVCCSVHGAGPRKSLWCRSACLPLVARQSFWLWQLNWTHEGFVFAGDILGAWLLQARVGCWLLHRLVVHSEGGKLKPTQFALTIMP